jgi:hemoglobin
MTQAASIPFPETPEHRAAIRREIEEATGLDEALLERLVRTFYARARQDREIGPLFAAVQDWDEHIATITSFWSSVALLSGTYHGQPLAVHFPLQLEPPHFRRWLALFEQTARDVCSEAGASHLMDKAHRIARSLELGIAAGRGVLPVRRTPRS